jgi:hypothetical protein
MSNSGIESVYLGEAVAVPDEIVQTWTNTKEKVILLASKLRSMSTALEWPVIAIASSREHDLACTSCYSVEEESRSLIAYDGVIRAKERYDYWSLENGYAGRRGRFLLWIIVSIFAFFVILIVYAGVEGKTIESTVILWAISVGVLLLLCCVRTSICFCIAKYELEKAEDRARVSDEVMAVMKEAAGVTDSAWTKTQLWDQAKGKTLEKLLMDNDTPQVHEKVVPVFSRLQDATKAWEKAKLVCQQAMASVTDRSIAEEATRISEAVIAAEAVSKEIEEILRHVISPFTNTQ